MKPARTNSVPFHRAIVVAAALWCSASASACITNRPSHDGVSFAKWIARVDQIVLARVTHVRRLPANEVMEGNTVRKYLDPYEFTFQTIERIKGNGPAQFRIGGHPDDDGAKTAARRTAQHDGLGSFWGRFGYSCPSPGTGLSFSPGRHYLLLRFADGTVSNFLDRGAEMIPRADDQWLAAVRAIVRDPSLKKGRRTALIDFLASSQAVLLVETVSCERDQAVDGRIVRQLWGAPLDAQSLSRRGVWGYRDECDAGQRRLVVFPDDEYGPLMLRVSPLDTVDFTGFADGSDQGQVVFGASTWSSQIEFEGPRLWSLGDLERALRAHSGSIQVH